MRQEATIEVWRELYQLATKIKELKPWEQFWDMDLIAIQDEHCLLYTSPSPRDA